MWDFSYFFRMTDVFNSREISIGTWLIVFLILSSTRKDFRQIFLKLMASFTNGAILIPILLMATYNVAVVRAMEILGLWRISQLKDTILWFIFTGLVTAFHLFTDQKDPQSIKKVIKDNVKLIIVLEFIVNTYTFPLYIELILFPILVILGGMAALAERDSKYSSVATVTKWMLSLFGTGAILYVVISIIYDYKHFASIDTLHDILLPPILTILSLPVIYMIMLYMAYESLFFRLRIFLRESPKLQKYAMKKLIIQCKFNLTKVKRALGENSYQLFDAKSQEEVERIIFEKSAAT